MNPFFVKNYAFFKSGLQRYNPIATLTKCFYFFLVKDNRKDAEDYCGGMCIIA